MKKDRIQNNEDGTLDEVVIDKCMFHLEQMDDGHWWIGIYRGDETWHLNLTTSRGAKIKALIRKEEAIKDIK